jgi:RNA polymerase sigma-70 factor, ECF subfamily
MDLSLPARHKLWPLTWPASLERKRPTDLRLSQPQTEQEDGPRDQALVREALAGSQVAREALALRLACIPPMLRALLRRAGWRVTPHDLEDLAQDVFTTVWRRLEDFDGRGQLEVWIFGFCRNRCLKWRERGAGRIEARGGEENPLLDIKDQREGPSADALDLDHLRRCVAGLPRPMAQVVELKHFEDLTFEELGQRLQCSPNTAKTRYYRALELLSTSLSSLAPDQTES